MARKSRRNAGIPIGKTEMETFPTAIYARLSVENSGKDDNGASIGNQIEVCREYVRERPDLQLAKVYQDNGWTGTVMRRPAFEEMMSDAAKGLIKAIVVRDLYRFARNYIEIGTYLESILPDLGVRFISVKERFDTLEACTGGGSLAVPLQNLINDLYSKDISRKVETALRAQMERGTFRWRLLPYGYRWDESHVNIVPDERTAPVVRQIYQWRLEGVSVQRMARMLDEMEAPKYMQAEGEAPAPWATSSINEILQNPAYAGTRVYGVRHSAIYMGVKLEKRPEEEWFVMENAHEPLADAETYEAVRKSLEANSEKRRASMARTAKDRAKLVDLFQGKAFCADCGHRMYFKRGREDCKDRRWFATYYCSSFHNRRRDTGCSYHYLRQDVLEPRVLEAIRLQVRVALDYGELIRKYRESEGFNGFRNSLNAKIKSVSLKLNAVKEKRGRLYEDYASGILDAGEYAFAKAAFERDYETLNGELETLSAKKAEFSETMSDENKWLRAFKGLKRTRKLTQGLVDAAIDKVLVHEGGDIEIVFRHEDVFRLTEKYLRGEADGNEGGWLPDCRLHPAFRRG